MKNTIILCSTNRSIHDQTRLSIQEGRVAGARYIETHGCADVSLARNVGLSQVHAAMQRPELAGIDTLVMVDDDMVFTLETVNALVAHARSTGIAASAMYATTLGTLAGSKWKGHEGRWLTGLGLLAVPMKEIDRLAAVSPRFKLYGPNELVAFTWSTPDEGEWWSEDYTLCKRLGGVALLPVVAGHLKTIPLLPDDVTVERIRAGENLPDFAAETAGVPPVVATLGDDREAVSS